MTFDGALQWIVWIIIRSAGARLRDMFRDRIMVVFVARSVYPDSVRKVSTQPEVACAFDGSLQDGLPFHASPCMCMLFEMDVPQHDRVRCLQCNSDV